MRFFVLFLTAVVAFCRLELGKKYITSGAGLGE